MESRKYIPTIISLKFQNDKVLPHLLPMTRQNEVIRREYIKGTYSLLQNRGLRVHYLNIS